LLVVVDSALSPPCPVPGDVTAGACACPLDRTQEGAALARGSGAVPTAVQGPSAPPPLGTRSLFEQVISHWPSGRLTNCPLAQFSDFYCSDPSLRLPFGEQAACPFLCLFVVAAPPLIKLMNL